MSLTKKKNPVFFFRFVFKTLCYSLLFFSPSLLFTKAKNVKMGDWSVCGTSHALQLQFRLLK